jgi:hypothetical protein
VLGQIRPEDEGLLGAAACGGSQPSQRPTVRVRDEARSPRPKPARWHGQPRLAGAHGGARSAAQARGSLRAGARQGVWRGAHPSGVPMTRGRSSGGRLHTSTPDDEVVAGGDLGEVLRLGRGYAIVRAEPIQKRRRGCGAH